MSLFRKPTKKIQRRVFGCGDDEDDGEPEAPPPPIISNNKKEKQAEKKSSTLLSFVDEEEEVEEFKVKKSNHSKRWARQKEKVKRKPPDYDSNIFYEDEPVNNFSQQDEPKPATNAKPKAKKKVNLEGLILTGREAAAAIGSLADEEESEEEDDRGFPRFRPESVRAALAAASGNIPDAALIHAARKTRQQARELGGAEYIPIHNKKSGPGSRLVREDGSGDDEEERIHVRGIDLPSDKPTRDMEAQSDADVDSEVEQWEEQQMQKGVPAITDIGVENGMGLNPFAVVPPPPRFPPPHLMPLPGRAIPDNVPALHVSLSDRLKELKVAHAEMEQQRDEISARLTNARETLAERKSCAAPLDDAYRDAQAIRGYLTDLVECLDEKMPALVALEKRALAVHRRRCELIQERRRADVRDQAQDLLALAARPGSVRQPDSEDKIRRAAEREGRRRARRMRREALGSLHRDSHRDGDSSDDQLAPHQVSALNTDREAIRAESAELFNDALPAWRSARAVCRRLSRRARHVSQAAYLPDCLPGLLAPFVRHELLLWNPLADEDNEDYERMDWYRSTMMYGLKVEKDVSDSEDEIEEDNASLLATLTEESVSEDPDLMLVPTLVHKIVVPKLTELIEVSWDPMCVRSCVRLSAIIDRVCGLPPRAPNTLRSLGTTVTQRLNATLAADTFLPALPPQLSEGPGGIFWRRCLGVGIRLLRAAFALYAPPLLRTDVAVLSLIGTLCTAAGAAPPHLAALAAVAITNIVAGTPQGTLRDAALRRTAALANRIDASVLPYKLKEQVESLLTEARELGPESE